VVAPIDVVGGGIRPFIRELGGSPPRTCLAGNSLPMPRATDRPEFRRGSARGLGVINQLEGPSPLITSRTWKASLDLGVSFGLKACRG
jgi:hypothetical protein